MAIQKITTAEIVIGGTNEEVGEFFSSLRGSNFSRNLADPIEVYTQLYDYRIIIHLGKRSAILFNEALENGILRKWAGKFTFIEKEVEEIDSYC